MGFFGALFLALTGGAKVIGGIKDAHNTKQNHNKATSQGRLTYFDSHGVLRLTTTGERVHSEYLRNGDKVLKGRNGRIICNFTEKEKETNAYLKLKEAEEKGEDIYAVGRLNGGRNARFGFYRLPSDPPATDLGERVRWMENGEDFEVFRQRSTGKYLLRLGPIEMYLNIDTLKFEPEFPPIIPKGLKGTRKERQYLEKIRQIQEELDKERIKALQRYSRRRDHLRATLCKGTASMGEYLPIYFW